MFCYCVSVRHRHTDKAESSRTWHHNYSFPRQRPQTLLQLLLQQVKSFWSGCFSVTEKWLQEAVWTENSQPVAPANDGTPAPPPEKVFCSLDCWSFSGWEAILELSSPERKLTALIVHTRADWCQSYEAGSLGHCQGEARSFPCQNAGIPPPPPTQPTQKIKEESYCTWK